MDTQNITISLPKELLKKIKHIAIDRNTSVSGLLKDTLEEILKENDNYELAFDHFLNELETGYNLGTESDIKWRRDDLYKR